MIPKFPKTILDEGIKDLSEIIKAGEYFCVSATSSDGISTTKLRKFYGAVKKIEVDFQKRKSDIILLVPQLAYDVGRAPEKEKPKLRDLFNIVSSLVSEIKEDETKFKNFAKLLEAIVAYHKFYSKEK